LERKFIPTYIERNMLVVVSIFKSLIEGGMTETPLYIHI
jgi:hypothetical protein